MDIRPGQIITATNPPQVRFDGDTFDQAIPLKLTGYTPTVGDRVLLARVGSGWVILGDYT